MARSQKCKFAVFEGESKCCECKKITDRIDLLANVKAEPLEPPLTASDQLSSSKKPHQIKLSNQKVANKKETSPPNRENASTGEKRLALLTGLGSISIQPSTGVLWSPTQLYSADFSQSRIGVRKCVFNKRTIKVCVSCCWRCPGTSAPSSPYLTVSLYLCSSGSNARGESRA